MATRRTGMRGVAALVTVAALAVAGACGDGSGRVERVGPTGAARDDRSSTTTTVPPGPGEAGVRTESCQGAAPVDRDCAVFLPAEARTDERLPVVLLLHGFAVGPTSIRDAGRWIDALGTHRFVLVTPHGVADAWNAGGCCGVPRLLGTDDVGYLRALVAQVAARPDVDAGRIYLAGHSNGGMMAYRLLCDPAVPVVAMASVAGTDVSGCQAARPVPVLHVHATGDLVVPVAGGASVAMLLLGVDLPPLDATLDARAASWACAPPEVRTEGAVTSRRWTGCAGGAVIDQRTIAGATHDWQRPPIYDTTAEVLAFFGIT